MMRASAPPPKRRLSGSSRASPWVHIGHMRLYLALSVFADRCLFQPLFGT